MQAPVAVHDSSRHGVKLCQWRSSQSEHKTYLQTYTIHGSYRAAWAQYGFCSVCTSRYHGLWDSLSAYTTETHTSAYLAIIFFSQYRWHAHMVLFTTEWLSLESFHFILEFVDDTSQNGQLSYDIQCSMIQLVMTSNLEPQHSFSLYILYDQVVYIKQSSSKFVRNLKWQCPIFVVQTCAIEKVLQSMHFIYIFTFATLSQEVKKKSVSEEVVWCQSLQTHLLVQHHHMCSTSSYQEHSTFVTINSNFHNREL